MYLAVKWYAGTKGHQAKHARATAIDLLQNFDVEAMSLEYHEEAARSLREGALANTYLRRLVQATKKEKEALEQQKKTLERQKKEAQEERAAARRVHEAVLLMQKGS